MAETITQLKDISEESKTVNVSPCSILTDRICTSIRDNLPSYIQQLPEFEDCSIEYLQIHRIIFITPEGLGVDMDRRQNDVNYFQIREQEISKEYEELDVEYISERKAKKYDSFGITGMFRSVHSDLRERLTSDH